MALKKRCLENSEPSWFGFLISVREDAPFNRNDIVKYLNDKKIGTRLLFAGNIIKQPYMKDRNYRVIGNLKNIDGLGKVIAIELKGEQTKYINEISQGIKIIINASITFAKNTAANKTDLTLRYTNDNGNEKYYETKTSLDLISKNGVLVYSKVNNYNNEGTVLESTTNENLNGKLDINTKQKNIKIERSIVNNTEDTISGISIVGKIPTTEENVNGENLKSTFVSKLKNINVEGKNGKQNLKK